MLNTLAVTNASQESIVLVFGATFCLLLGYCLSSALLSHRSKHPSHTAWQYPLLHYIATLPLSTLVVAIPVALLAFNSPVDKSSTFFVYAVFSALCIYVVGYLLLLISYLATVWIEDIKYNIEKHASPNRK